MSTHVNEKSTAGKTRRNVPAGSPLAGEVGAGLGIIAGASAGAVAGEAVGAALHRRAEARSKHDRELDEAISLAPGATGVDAELDFPEPVFPEPVKNATFLRADHDQLEALAQSLVRTIVEGDRDDVGAAITVMQTRVLAHLDGEERSLLGGYARYAPEDARELLREHAMIRQALAEFDVGVDLHLVRADAVKAFLGALQAHAERENAGLYRWAATAPGPTAD